ncbi:MAG: iron-containing alcohol dehydrogenase [Desulfobacterota bacterium]|jgi:NADP-dependent alcohol dehydrogenase|nr:iron-containing alcohol dehydrogenase [Thermodesulfobacteriota bacterium]
MDNFVFCNPTRILFGKGQISELSAQVPKNLRAMLVYGGGSIKANGVYDQVIRALAGRELIEFSGIEANPLFETCMAAVEKVKRERIGYLLAAGGGSVFDACKFIAAAVCYEGKDPWDICVQKLPLTAALPWGGVLTLPATASEMNSGSVITRQSTQQKLFFFDPLVFPQFSILDPETTYSLPPRQTANGVIDTFIHTTERYLTFANDSFVVDRMAEGILATLIELGPKALRRPRDYAVRANLMWAATLGHNGILDPGMPQDWASHMIGHELTALYGVDHAQSLAVVLPGLLRHQRKRKQKKLLQYGERIWKIRRGTAAQRVESAIRKTEEFFRSLGVGTTFADYGIPAEDCGRIAERAVGHQGMLGEHKDLGVKEVAEVLRLCVGGKPRGRSRR